MSAHCCGHTATFDGLSADYKRRLWLVIAINASMFAVEIGAGALAGSQALQADALDFLADATTYGMSLAVIGLSAQTRATVALAKAASLTAMALWVLGSTAYHVLVLGVPHAEIMGAVGVLALAANLASVLILVPTRMATPMCARSGCARATTPSAMSPSCSPPAPSG
jgi:Co/Zn/Cd efflux system component